MKNQPPSGKKTNCDPDPPQLQAKRFLVCGLGSLGQYCIAVLQEFGARVSGIDKQQPSSWEIPELPHVLDALIIGDCCHLQVLEQAQIQECQAILLVTDDVQVNVEAAFTARRLNPDIRLVIRSAKQKLNELLRHSLGNFVAFEPWQLSTSAFALAALGKETQALLTIDDQLLRVVKRHMHPHDHWSHRPLFDLNTRTRRLLECTRGLQAIPSFHAWEPEARVQDGDTLVYVEAIAIASTTVAYSEFLVDSSPQPTQRTVVHPLKKRRQVWHKLLSWKAWQQSVYAFWQSTERRQSQRVAILCGIAVVVMTVLGTSLYWWQYPNANLMDAFHATASLLLGGYGDVFGGVKLELPVSVGLQLFSLMMALAGTAFVGVLYALLTENLLSTRFQFLMRRPPVPKQDHIVLIGLNQVGQAVAEFFQEFKQPLVGISQTDLEANTLPHLPLLVGDIDDALEKSNLVTARSVIVATEDEMTNLEVALMVHAANPDAGLVIRMFDQRFSDNLGQLLPYARVICTNFLAAEAFAGAAFGENILGLFRLNDQTILLTEYRVEAQDTLSNLLLAEVAYGYDVVPVLHHKISQEPKWMPSDDIRLQVGDRLIVLATIAGLQRIERGELAPRYWQVWLEKAITQEAIFEGATVIARVCGCSLGTAREVMAHLPGRLPVSLYEHQAHRLVRELQKAQVVAQFIHSKP
jgi:Trk K+ transport system NAD-binding subunit